MEGAIGWTGRNRGYRWLRSLNILGFQRAVLLVSGVLFGVLAICIFPVFCRFHEGSIIMGADKLQCLLVFGIFVTGVVAKRLNGLAAVIPPQSPQVTRPLVRQHFFILYLARLKSRESSRYPVLQPLQVFKCSRQVPQYAPQQPISSVPFIVMNSLQPCA